MFRKFKTISIIIYTCILVLPVLQCNGEDFSEDYETVLEENSKLKDTKPKDTEEFDMEHAIQNIESLAVIAEQVTKVNDLIPEEDAENFYDYMIQAIDRVQNALGHSDNIYKFMKANGVLRVLSNNLVNTHYKLRTKLLLLLKDIFNIAPTTADTLLPLNIVDRLIDIFENDNNLALKAHSLDVLYIWLPNNIQAQLRVMKISGLETFYKQIDKLEIGVVTKLMDLFNKILKEHLDIKNREKVTDDVNKMRMYQSIGILERMSTPKTCNGLLNIFEMMWSYNRNENDNIKLILDLMKNIKPFCLNFYKKKAKAAELFQAMLEFVKNEEKREYFENLNMNVTDVANVVEEYLRKEKRVLEVKDEF